ncbi:MAG: winged helix-turn-helix domain-containing protein [Candidatus Solibacter usitatus]|nr:winged helix-turn-helix domain-containing protein [Candidatus Solibacter usitatus]
MRSYRFGPFLIDTEQRLLRRGNEAVPLPPKAVDTLLALLANAGRVLKKEELLKTVWPETFVEEGGLARNISQLRKALGEGPDDIQYIETHSKLGYRFIAEVIVDDEATKPLPIEPPKPPPIPGPWKLGRRTLVAAAAGALALGYYAYSALSRGPVLGTLVVMPLKNLSGDPAQDPFAESTTEALVTNLAKVGSLRVYRGPHYPSQVEAILDGGVLLTGERVRVTARLVRAKTGEHIWADSYERELRDTVELQGSVAIAVVRGIQAKMTPQENQRLARVQPVTPQAYRAYVKGLFWWNKRTAEGFQRAIENFTAAIQYDPKYAPAYSGLADTYALLASTPYNAWPPREAFPRAAELARKALELDGSLAEPHASLAMVKLCYDWDAAGADREFQRALESNPGYATARHWHSHNLLAMGRLNEALAEMTRALELDPLSLPIGAGVGWCHYYTRAYDKAIEQYRKTLEMDKNYVLLHSLLGLAYDLKGSRGEAISEFATAVNLAPDNAPARAGLGHAYAVAGRMREAREQLDRLKAQSGKQYVPFIMFAYLYAGLGDKEAAFEWLRKACEERSDYMMYLKVDPTFDELRSDARFASVLRCVQPR